MNGLQDTAIFIHWHIFWKGLVRLNIHARVFEENKVEKIKADKVT